ncbi:MAG: hypothetical protein WD025_08760 [Bacteriovoracaceae bacterium]
MKYFFIIVTSLWTISAVGLEIDEKLTLRVVKTSDSKKTILINRGKEDGVEKGDHAKFYLSVGVVARGVAIKISPTRSVWSLYRLVNADYIRDEQVMKLKATAPVKITKDESRALVEDDTPSAVTQDPRDLGIALAPGAEDLDFQDPDAVSAAQSSEAVFTSSNLVDKNKEVFGGFHYQSRSSQTAADNTNFDSSGTDTAMLLDVGFEYHFEDENQWYSSVAFLGAFRMARSSVLAFEGTEVQESASLFGGGFNWYPLTKPSRTYRFIPFGQFIYYMGSVASSFTLSQASHGSTKSDNLSGSVSMFTFGGGVKYYLHNGWGASVKVELESRADSFAEDQVGVMWQKVSSGPRVMTALSYRF